MADNPNNNDENIVSSENKGPKLSERVESAIGDAKSAKKVVDWAKSVESLAPVVTVISTILIILLIIIVLIGTIAFFFTMPGLAMSQIQKTCQELWKWATGDESIQTIGSEEINNLATYIQERGYDIVGFGFASSNSVTKTRDSETNQVSKVEIDLGEAPEMPIAQREIISLTNNTGIQLNSSSQTGVSSNTIFPSGVMNDVNIVQVKEQGTGNIIGYYRAVDEDGNNISFFDNNGNPINYEVTMDEEQRPVFRRSNSGNVSVNNSGNVAGTNLLIKTEGVSFNDFKRLISSNRVTDQNISDAISTAVGYIGLNNQEEYIYRMNNAYGSSESEGINNLRNYVNSLEGTGSIVQKVINKIQNMSKTDAIAELEKFQSLVNNASTNLSENASTYQSEYYNRRQNLFNYLLANERTYTTQGIEEGFLWKLVQINPMTGALGHFASFISNIIKNDYKKNNEKDFGMLVINGELADKNKAEIEIDRDLNQMIIKAKNGFLNLNRDVFKWNLAGWTSRYGKPVELSMALHLATMAPDFVYDFCTNSALQTLVNINSYKVTYQMDYKYQKEGKQPFYKKDKDDEDGIITTYEKLAENKPHYDRIKWLFTDNVEIYQDDETYKQEDGYELPFLPPIDIINKTSIISISDENGENKKYYKAVDVDGNPIKISFVGFRPAIAGAEFSANNSAYNINFKSDGTPYFTVATNDNFSVNTLRFLELDDNLHTNSIDLGNNKILSLEILSLEDFNNFLSTVNDGFIEFKKSKTDDSKYKFARYNRYIKTLQEYDNFMNDTLENGILTSDNSSFNLDNIKSECEAKNTIPVLMNYHMNVEEPGVQNGWSYNKNGNNYYLLDNSESISSMIGETHEFLRGSSIYTNYSSKIYFNVLIDSMNNINNKRQYYTVFSQFYIYLRNSINAETSYLKDKNTETDMFKQTCDSIFGKRMNEIWEKYGIQTFGELKTLYEAFKDLPDQVESYKPYIESVTNHWYKDLKFGDLSDTNTVYVEDSRTITRTGDFEPAEEASYHDNIENLRNQGDVTIKYEMTTTDDIRQTRQPEIIKDEEWHYMVKNWILYGYYFIYDGTDATARKIEQAAYILSEEGLKSTRRYTDEEVEELKYDPTNPLLINMDDEKAQEKLSVSAEKANKIEEKAKKLNDILKESGSEVRLQHVVFDKKNSLQNAFPILENMHTEDSEYIYRDLKEFLMELGYFTRADFESIETDVFDWIIPTYKVYRDEWPSVQYEKNSMEYGTYVRSKASLDAQKEAEGEEVNTSASANNSYYETSGDGYESVTNINGAMYKNYKQTRGSYSTKPYWNGTIASDGCGPTSVSVLLSAYNVDKKPDQIVDYINNTLHHNETYGQDLTKAIVSNGISAEYHNIPGSVTNEDVENVQRALEDQRPVLITVGTGPDQRFTTGNHWMCLLGLTTDGKVIISNVGNALEQNTVYDSVESLMTKYMDNHAYVIATVRPSSYNLLHTVQGFEEGQEIIAPENGEIIEIGTVEQNNAEGQTGETNYFTTNGQYVIIKFNTGNGVNGWQMKIEGFRKDPTIYKGKTVTKGEILGQTTDGNLKITLIDDKNAIINDVEDYFKLPKRKNRGSSSLGELEDLIEFLWKDEGVSDADRNDGDYYTVVDSGTDIPTIGHGLTGWTIDTWEELGYGQYFTGRDEDGKGIFVQDPIPKEIVDEVAQYLIQQKYESLEEKLNEYGITDWGNDQKNAITSFIYNYPLGLDGCLTAYKNGGTDEMIEFLLSCYHFEHDDPDVKTQTERGLRKRRIDEVELFLNGKYDLSYDEISILHRQYYGYDF